MNSENTQATILLIYTGGTIGMIRDSQTGLLKPFNFARLLEEVPELSKFNIKIDTYSFPEPIDSSDMHPGIWAELAGIIGSRYAEYDGFVVLHGSDTMSYTASALSFMLENLGKPVVLTGSQLPIGTIRTDGKENLITSIEIAAARHNSLPVVPEVCVYFEYKLYRGNRTHKYNAEHFDAFHSPNYPALAEAGVHIQFNTAAFLPMPAAALRVHTAVNTNIAVLKLFPGITPQLVQAVLHTPGLKAVILETFGSGNATRQPWFAQMLEDAIQRGIIFLNITQCAAGRVEQGRYETSSAFARIGVVGGSDMTTEAGVAKLMFLLGQNLSTEEIKAQLSVSLRGELSQVI
ncbi:MAG: type I asparaginase [Bacteroidia bacterium]|jgi:L-asparaginase|nr:type I asparaginase [Bacteroidia bacterium]